MYVYLNSSGGCSLWAFYVITWTKVWKKAWDITTAEATVKPYPSQTTEVT